MVGAMPQTSLWIKSKHSLLRVVELEKGKVLLFPNLQASHSNETESRGLFNNLV